MESLNCRETDRDSYDPVPKELLKREYRTSARNFHQGSWFKVSPSCSFSDELLSPVRSLRPSVPETNTCFSTSTRAPALNPWNRNLSSNVVLSRAGSAVGMSRK